MQRTRLNLSKWKREKRKGKVALTLEALMIGVRSAAMGLCMSLDVTVECLLWRCSVS